MTIEKIAGYKVGEQVFSTIEEAQTHALAAVLDGLDEGQENKSALQAAEIIVNNKDEVIRILRMGPNSRRPKSAKPTRSHKKKPTPDAEPPAGSLAA